MNAHLFEAGLLLDAGHRRTGQVWVRMRDGDTTWRAGVFELVVRAVDGDLDPSISFDFLDYIPATGHDVLDGVYVYTPEWSWGASYAIRVWGRP